MELEERRSELRLLSTIHEEEDDDDDDDEDFSSAASSSVNSVKLTPGRNPDVIIHVGDSCFHLHKAALIAKSTYLKRQLSNSCEITLSPPLKIKPETFSLIADFCYGDGVFLTLHNLAAIRTAAALLGMTEIGCSADDENLMERTETYFISMVSFDTKHASIVLRSCFPLLPEAETAAGLVSRCLETLSTAAEDDLDLDVFKSVAIEELQEILESSSLRLIQTHDLLYKIIDIYLEENTAILTEDQRIQICNYLDCTILSTQSLIHAVQNPRMPLRFIFQAMLLQQLNNRCVIISTVDHQTHRDTALRQFSHLKTVMSATNSRIQSLEKELSGLRRQLQDETGGLRSEPQLVRSSSYRSRSETDSRVERDQVRSISALSVRDFPKKLIREEDALEPSDGDRRAGNTLGARVVRALKNAFRLQRLKREKGKARMT